MTTPDAAPVFDPRRDLRTLLLFLALATAWTWPLAAHLSLRIPHDPGDPILNTWILWWNTQALPFTERWWNAPIFVPMTGALALSEHLFGIALVTTPLQWAGAAPLTAYNIAVILSFGLSGFFAFLLGRHLTGSSAAGLVAGLAFGFAPYRASQLSHLQVLTSQWMPLALLAMHVFVERGGARWLLLLAAAWLVQAWSNGYYLLFFPILMALWALWFVDWRGAPRRGIRLALAWAASSVLLIPALVQYVVVQRQLGLERTVGEMVMYSARADSFARPGGLLRFWPSSPGTTQEEYLFTGITPVLLLAAAGAAAARRRAGLRRTPLLFYALAAVCMYALAFGPTPPGGWAIAHPYTLLTYLPGFGGLRAPARFAMLGVLCLAMASGLAFARLAPRRPLLRGAFLALAVAGLVIDGWMRAMPLAPAPGRAVFPDIPGAAVVELPVDDGMVSTAAMYRQIGHGKPLINGYSGYTPPHYAILSIALDHRDPTALLELSRGRPLILAIDERRDPGGALSRLVEGLPGIQGRGTTSAGRTFVLPAAPAARIAPEGRQLDTVATALEREHVILDVGQPRTVRTIAFPLRWHYPELAGRLAVETSLDGRAWTTVWEDWTGGVALAGALEDPRENPVRITLPDPVARFIRIHPSPPWLTRELRVYGPR